MAGPYGSYTLAARQRAAQGMMAPKNKREKADDIGGYIGGGIGGVLGAMYGGPLGAYQGWGSGRRFGEAAVGGHRKLGEGDVGGFLQSGPEAVSQAVVGQQGMAGMSGMGVSQSVNPGMQDIASNTRDKWSYQKGAGGAIDVPGYYQAYGTGSQPVPEAAITEGAGGVSGNEMFSSDEIDTLVGMF